MRSARRNERGIALVELALVVPVLFFIILAAVEYGMLLKKYEQLSHISREAANSAFRECATQATPQACIDTVTARSTQAAQVLVPGAAVILSLYRYDSTMRRTQLQAVNQATANARGFTTRYSPGSFSATTINNDNKTVVASEVFYQAGSMTKVVNAFFSSSPRVLYETTVF